jgi:hypothetical protein
MITFQKYTIYSPQCDNSNECWSEIEECFLSFEIQSADLEEGLDKYFQPQHSKDSAICSKCLIKCGFTEKHEICIPSECLILYIQPTASQSKHNIPLILNSLNLKCEYILKAIIFDYALQNSINEENSELMEIAALHY